MQKTYTFHFWALSSPWIPDSFLSAFVTPPPWIFLCISKPTWLNRALSPRPSFDSIRPRSTSRWSPKVLHPDKGQYHSPCCSCRNPSVLLDSCPLLTHALCLGKQQILLALLSKYSNWSHSHSASTQIWATVTLFGWLQESQAPSFSTGIPVPCSMFLREWEEFQRENLITLMPWFSDSYYHSQCHTCGVTGL